MPTEQEIEQLEREWKAEGHSPEVIGQRIRQLADAEAARLEAAGEGDESDEEEETADDEQARLLQEAHSVYIATVLEVLGDAEPIRPCVLCSGRGWNAADVVADPDTHKCETCHGIGIVVTGSLVEGNATRICRKCNGSGFIEDVPSVVAPVAPVVPPFVAPPVTVPPVVPIVAVQ